MDSLMKMAIIVWWMDEWGELKTTEEIIPERIWASGYPTTSMICPRAGEMDFDRIQGQWE